MHQWRRLVDNAHYISANGSVEFYNCVCNNHYHLKLSAFSHNFARIHSTHLLTIAFDLAAQCSIEQLPPANFHFSCFGGNAWPIHFILFYPFFGFEIICIKFCLPLFASVWIVEIVIIWLWMNGCMDGRTEWLVEKHTIMCMCLCASVRVVWTIS